MKDLPDTECQCEKCKKACKIKPCIPLPSEVLKLVEAGYGDRLMLDWWYGDGVLCEFGRNIYMVVPAIEGSECEYAPLKPLWKGQCVFQDENDLCELHDKKLKPYEGRKKDHTNFGKESANIKPDLARAWDTVEGRAIVKSWKETYLKDGAVPPEEGDPLTVLPILLQSLVDEIERKCDELGSGEE